MTSLAHSPSSPRSPRLGGAGINRGGFGFGLAPMTQSMLNARQTSLSMSSKASASCSSSLRSKGRSFSTSVSTMSASSSTSRRLLDLSQNNSLPTAASSASSPAPAAGGSAFGSYYENYKSKKNSANDTTTAPSAPHSEQEPKTTSTSLPPSGFGSKINSSSKVSRVWLRIPHQERKWSMVGVWRHSPVPTMQAFQQIETLHHQYPRGNSKVPKLLKLHQQQKQLQRRGLKKNVCKTKRFKNNSILNDLGCCQRLHLCPNGMDV